MATQKGANRRTGRSRGYNGQKGGAHTVAWRDDPVILDRIRVGMAPWSERRPDMVCLDIVNKYLEQRYKGTEPPISMDTLREDRKRGMELHKEQAVEAGDRYVRDIDHAIEETWRAFHSAGSASLNRSGFVNAVKGLLELQAKLDGRLKPDNQINVLMVQQVGRLRETLDALMHDPRWLISDEQRQQGMALLSEHLEERARLDQGDAA